MSQLGCDAWPLAMPRLDAVGKHAVKLKAAGEKLSRQLDFFFGVRLNSVSTICPLHALIPNLQNANSIKLLSHKEVVKIIHIRDGEIFRGHKWV